MAEVYDRWHKSRPAPGAQRCREHDKVPTTDHGQGMRWQVRYRDADGKQRKENFARKPAADARANAVGSALDRGTYLDPAAGKVTLRVHAEAWLDAQTFDETTRQTVRSRLDVAILPALGDRELRAIRPSTVQAFIRGLQAEGRAPRYVQVIVAALSSVLSAAVDDGLIATNPCRATSVRPPKVESRKVIPWTVERVLAVADALPDRYESMVYTGYGTGQRQGEILAFGPDDVDWLGRVVHVRRQIRIVRNTLVFAPPKGGKERDVPLSSETSLRLAAHMRAHPPAEVTLPWKLPEGRPTMARLFFTKAGAAVHRAWFNVTVWSPALKAAGVPAGRENGMHVLRHTYASTLLAGGVDIRALAEYLGHTDPGFTLRTYTHLMPAAEDRARLAVDLAYRAGAAEERLAR